MPKHGKNYRDAVKNIDLTAAYAVDEAMKMALAASFAKFDETVDVAMCLGVNPKYSDQMVRGAVTLPHGLGKVVRIVAFCKGDKEAEAKAAGADFAGADELIEKIKGGWLEFDKAVATPDMMASVGKIGKLLGPRGLMPNAKTGTVTFDIASAIGELKAGRVEFRVDKAGVLHAPLGKRSFGAEKLLENFKAVMDTVMRLKPSSAKGTYLKTMAMATTMGPGIKVDTVSIRKFLEG
ncbi:50S ribosomal protein L1 [Desulfovibrio sulfodismutans]|uniref:Large ribosomal subunit protein uL1 n=1 Tax=Desulfolutivibrio sulfodismutans TaxID=63561 RepID=A0A7K3NM02_9BACT|nr:50S ribosomal protein L1 [Desulfolutivibrio sulfodismutans]NDY56795.1 50S ribosomal protein L1 [Desulfolutivibrio sulfodismutans]QLA10935.1 50S ribosomal protein L1 [Desulfolutivibrio sulfodismutans DSM 3696]